MPTEERENLIPLGEIVVLSDRTSIRDAFKTLHSRHAGGFVVTEGDQSLARYVDVKALRCLSPQGDARRFRLVHFATQEFA